MRYLILLRCYRNLQERLAYGERQKLTSEYDNIRQFYHHENNRIRDELKRIKELAVRESIDLDKLDFDTGRERA